LIFESSWTAAASRRSRVVQIMADSFQGTLPG
jgi:hypothetical protein